MLLDLPVDIFADLFVNFDLFDRRQNQILLDLIRVQVLLRRADNASRVRVVRMLDHFAKKFSIVVLTVVEEVCHVFLVAMSPELLAILVDFNGLVSCVVEVGGLKV